MAKKIMSFIIVLALVLAPSLSFNTSAATVAGSGTAESPYLIYTQSDLVQVTTLGLDKHYKLMSDIWLYANWTPFSTFSGVFDGNNHSIQNINILSASNSQGLFSKTNGATIKNLTVDGGEIKGASYVGAIVGDAQNTKITNCTSNVTIISSLHGVAGIAGRIQKSNIKRCINKGNISSSGSIVGGIAGWIDDSTTTTNSITECINKGNISCSGNGAGGIVGNLQSGYATIANCYNTGNITANYYAGGILGYMGTGHNLLVSKCYSTGEVFAKDLTAGIVGGAVGYLTSATKNFEYCVAINTKITTTDTGKRPYRIVFSETTGFQSKGNLALDTMELYGAGKKVNATSGTAYDGKSITLAELKTQAPYAGLGWDFESIWIMGAEFPELRFTLPTEVAVNEVAVTPQTHSMDVGAIFNLQAEVNPADATDKSIVWTSSDDSIASVNSSGIVTALKVGQATIKATTSKGIFGVSTITVKDSVASDMRLCINVSAGDDIILSVTDDISENANFTWVSNDDSVATVNSDGIITGVSIGQCKITAKDDSGFNQSLYVRVVEAKEKEVGGEVIKINDNDSRIVYSGNWLSYNDPLFYGGDEKYTDEVNAYAELQFEGVSVSWIGATANNLGKCDVYIDGEMAEQGIDLYSETLVTQKVLFSKTGLSRGLHTIKIVVTGEKNPNSTISNVTVDAFEFVS